MHRSALRARPDQACGLVARLAAGGAVVARRQPCPDAVARACVRTAPARPCRWPAAVGTHGALHLHGGGARPARNSAGCCRRRLALAGRPRGWPCAATACAAVRSVRARDRGRHATASKGHQSWQRLAPAGCGGIRKGQRCACRYFRGCCAFCVDVLATARAVYGPNCPVDGLLPLAGGRNALES